MFYGCKVSAVPCSEGVKMLCLWYYFVIYRVQMLQKRSNSC